MTKIDIFDKINNKLIVSFIKQIFHRCSCKVISSYIRKFSTFQKEMFDSNSYAYDEQGVNPGQVRGLVRQCPL